ncbi:MAG: FtsW/RodA/SpoVE family cell cycle protein [Deltaproteobacteria bacterium]|nr:FtsW/RodA/SpoVE family cell cycle protein [Deltaproteobacteria bacterium]
MFDRRLIQNFDWMLLIITLLLAASGLITLYSAARAGLPITQAFYLKQFMWYGIGFVIMIVSFLISYKQFDQYAYAAYAICIFLLAAVLLVGKLVAGSKRWLVFGAISFQPSELAKVAVILVLSRYYSRTASTKGMRLRDLVIPTLLIGIPFALIVKQPDLGTAVMILLIAATLTVFIKIEKRAMIAIVSFGPVAIPMIWLLLKGYQKQRILTFLEPDRDPLGAGYHIIQSKIAIGYHIIQSKIAIGSGMLSGKGFLEGTQNALSFLPEHHTDFIFSVLAEDWGFIGSVAVLSLFLILIVWGLNIAHGCRDPFGALLAVGITALIGWEVFINIGMVMGLMPVVGIPLPFISYGGSAILTMMLCMGILMNISMRKYLIE